MSEIAIRLDRNRPYSPCCGERATDDPHYAVHFLQAFKVGKDLVQLPFDADGLLVPDDGRNEPYPGIVEGKQITHRPLYNKAMRELVAAKRKRLAAAAAPPTEDELADAEVAGDNESSAADEVNFAAWLRGEVRYQPDLLRTAAKKRLGRNFGGGASGMTEMVTELVLDERLVPEDQVAPALRKYLPKQAA